MLIAAEFDEIRHRMALSAHSLASHLGEDDKARLDWILRTLESYDGPSRAPEFIAGLQRDREIPERLRSRVQDYRRQIQQQSGVFGKDMKLVSLPLTESIRAELLMCPIDFQRSVHGILREVDVYNQVVVRLHEFAGRKLDGVVAGSGDDPLQGSIEDLHGVLLERAEFVVRKIDEFDSAFG